MVRLFSCLDKLYIKAIEQQNMAFFALFEKDRIFSNVGHAMPCHQPLAHIISHRVAVGSQQRRKIFTLQTIPAKIEHLVDSERVAQVAGFSLHAGVIAEAQQRDKLKKLCWYISRSAVMGLI